MVLRAKSIPYSIKARGEWCRIIHDNQKPVCSHCNEVGQTRTYPEIECHIWNKKGHLSYDCDQVETDESSETGNNGAPPAEIAVVVGEQENVVDGEQAQKNVVVKEQEGEKVEHEEREVGKVDWREEYGFSRSRARS